MPEKRVNNLVRINPAMHGLLGKISESTGQPVTTIVERALQTMLFVESLADQDDFFEHFEFYMDTTKRRNISKSFVKAVKAWQEEEYLRDIYQGGVTGMDNIPAGRQALIRNSLVYKIVPVEDIPKKGSGRLPQKRKAKSV